MNIEFNLKELDGSEIDSEKIELLKTSLGIVDETEVGECMTKLAEAAVFEYIEMLVGNGMPNRADESKQNRLLYIIKKVFSPELLTEDEISVMFQLTKAQSKTLLRNTLSRYRTKLSSELKHTLKIIFESASKNDNDKWEVTINSIVLFEHLNLIIAKQGSDYNPIRKSTIGSRKYLISDDTYSLLKDYFGN